MDVNNLQSRLERMHYITNSRIDFDFKKYAQVTPIGEGVSVSLPGKIDTVKIATDIYSILQHLATLKDHLKNKLEASNLDKNIVELKINSSLHLQVLIDLVNQEKHGYPLTRSNRSNKRPVIKDMTYTLINNNHGNEVIMTIGTKGELDVVHGLPPSVAIFANVYDDQGNFIFTFDELVETTYTAWLSIVTNHNLT